MRRAFVLAASAILTASACAAPIDIRWQAERPIGSRTVAADSHRYYRPGVSALD